MALVSKAKAAKLAGVSRTTIHRYINDGKLSASDGKVDTSELLRVFGSINAPASEQSGTGVTVNTNEQHVTPEVQGGLQYKISLLETQIEDVRKDRDSWRNKADELTELLKAEQDNIKLLTHQNPANGNNNDGLALSLLAAVALLVALFLIWQSGG